MSIQDLGSLGELVASIAVVISLVYLAAQIRQGTRATRLASRQAILERFSTANADLARHQHMLKIVRESISGFDTLTAEQKTLLSQTLLPYAGNLYNALLLHEDGLLEDEPFEYIANSFVSYVSSPGGWKWWSESKGLMPATLIGYVEGRVAKSSLAVGREPPTYYGLDPRLTSVNPASKEKDG